MKYSNYLYRLAGLAAVLLILIIALGNTVLSEYYLPIHPWMVGLFAFVSGLEHWYLMKSIKNHPNRFSNVFMAASAIKLLSLLFVTVIYLVIDKSKVLPFVGVLFSLYVIFTGFEVRALQKLVKGNS
ncbi:MAG: hypothetical protein KAH17_03375 [Bacteroidales bacterium]|nr:hypothetical protein [Bacteroidales bacterium]